MPWFKVDDGFWSHPKVIELSDAAGWLWARAGSYCAKHLTNGRVTSGTLRMLAADRDAATELVLAGLWDFDAAENVWVFHDWAEYQPTREQVEAERAKTRERVEKHRANRVSNGARNGVTNGVSTGAPSRPVPTPTTTYVPESSHVTTAREVTDELSTDSFKSVVADQYGIDVSRVRAHIIDKLGITLTPTNTVAVSTWLLNKPKTIPHSPTKYVLGCVTRSPAEVEQYIHEAALI
ncbi:hypothetical protein [Pseudactinotalea sp.]|uniref:hypothetical protein n=1 Tax=Pseudactinotalea sp. TaxID=1926260 RepID=UPI003B3B236E